MDDLFLILALLSIVAFFVGLVKPSVVNKIFKRKSDSQRCSNDFWCSNNSIFVLFGITIGPSSQTQPTTKNSVVSEEQEQPSESAKQLSEKEQIQNCFRST